MMASPARTTEDIITILHATIGAPMTQYMIDTHNLGEDIGDLRSGNASLREFTGGLYEVLQIAANALPEEVPPTSKKAFILLNPRELRTIVDTIGERIAGKELSSLQR